MRTALCSADILLLDEPFGALDVITRGEMQDWLLAMRKELGKTVVLVPMIWMRPPIYPTGS